jgi:GAF domain-containing protein
VPPAHHSDAPADIVDDILAINAIRAVPTILKAICSITGMRFAAVARVTDGTWTACAVHDDLGFGLQPGGQLDLHTTLCKEVRLTRTTIAFDQASCDPTYRDHHTPHLYGLESYISVPIILAGDVYFGNLCAIDKVPAPVNRPAVLDTLGLFAQLIADHLDLLRSAAREASEAEHPSLPGGNDTSGSQDAAANDIRESLSAIESHAALLSSHADNKVVAAAREIRSKVQDIAKLLEVETGAAEIRTRLRLVHGVH